MGLTPKERAGRRRRNRELLERYAASHSTEETMRHVKAMRYPSGRHSHGGANRSSNIKREIHHSTVSVTLCVTCGGVSSDVVTLTSLFPLCSCLVQPP